MKKILSKIKDYFTANFYIMSFAFKTSGWMYIGTLLLGLFEYLIPMLSVFIWERTVNAFLEPAKERLFDNAAARWLFYYFLLMIILVFVRHFHGWLRDKTGNMIKHGVELEKIKKMSNVSAAYLDDPKNRDAAEAAAMDGDTVAGGGDSMINTFASIIALVTSITVFLSYSPIAGVIFLLTCVAGSIFTYKSEVALSLYNYDNIKESRQRDYYREILTSRKYAQEVRAYSNAGRFIRLFDEKLKELKNKLLKLHSKAAAKNLIGNFFTYFGVMVFSVWFTYKTLKGDILPGTLVLYIGLLVIMQEQVRRTLTDFIAEEMEFYVPHILSFRDFLSAKDDIEDKATLEFPDAPEITFSNVSFRYPGNDKYALRDVSFTVKSGSSIAVVGLNGAGKSTLIKLIMRIYEPESGEILVNGRDIREYSLKSLRRSFGVCFQQVSQYSLSLRESISIGDIEEAAEDSRIMDAIGIVELSDVLPESSLDVDLTKRFEEDGIELSGGQWQRLSLARAFYGKHKMLILDEPTSAVDPIAEDKIFRSFRTLCGKNGGIIISHHLSGVMDVDNILVLSDGRLIESGSHEELLTQNGHYAMLYTIQAEKFRKGLNDNEDEDAEA